MGLIACNAIGQVTSLDSSKFAYCEYDSVNGIIVFPENVLTNDYDFVITGFNKFKPDKKPMIEISWSSAYIDGIFSFVITPRQMYLRSHHNNPNPNYLYWLEKSDSLNLELIKNHFDNSKLFESLDIQSRPGHVYSFAKLINEDYLNDNWENKMYDNLSNIIFEINEAINQKDEKIELPSERQIWQASVRLLINKQEYDSQIKPIRIIGIPDSLDQIPDSMIIIDE